MTTTALRSSAVNVAINAARYHCRTGFRPNIILEVFRHFRTDQAARRVYLTAAGCETGFERGHAGKEILNPLIAREVCGSLGARAIREEDVPPNTEFCRSFSVLEKA
ncbi:MAG: hypothetical protein ACJ8AW_39095 [Rhodopila sp.]